MPLLHAQVKPHPIVWRGAANTHHHVVGAGVRVAMHPPVGLRVGVGIVVGVYRVLSTMVW